MSDEPGSANIVVCPNCGASQSPDAQFCTNCGALMPRTEANAPTPGPQPVQPAMPFETRAAAPPVTAAGGEPPQPPAAYPVTFDFVGPDRLSRLSTFFRIILMIPLLIFLAVLGGSSGGVLIGLVLAHWLSALVRGGRPVGWIGSAIVAVQRFQLRAYTYILLLTDQYPAFEGDWFASYEVQRPERISRRQIFFWKTLASIPHFIVLIVLWFAVAFCEVIGWFAILFTGRFPVGLRNFVVGWLRWSARVSAYWISLRDEFPPFSLSAEAAPGSKAASRFSALGGVAAIVVVGAAVGGVFLALGGTEERHVSYASLLHGTPSPQTIDISNVEITLLRADDPYEFSDTLFEAGADKRFLELDLQILDGRLRDLDIDKTEFRLEDEAGDTHDAAFVSVDGAAPPVTLREGRSATVRVIFEVPRAEQPSRLTYDPSGTLKHAEFIFDP